MKNKRLTWYFIVAFGAGWILQIAASICKVKEVGGAEAAQLLFTALLAACMFTPLLATVLSAKICGEKVGIKIRPNFKGNIRWYAAAWLLPALLQILGAALYFAVLRQNFDPEMTVMNESLKAAAAAGKNVEGLTPALALVASLASALTFGSFFNAFFAFGEEAGWRGYMTGALVEKLGRTKGLALSGVVWGAWHWPVIALAGYNFGTGYPLYPIPGLLAMCLACTALGIAFSFVYEKTESVWAPSLAHGAVNAIAGIGSVFLAPGITSLLLGPALGFISMIPWAVFAAVLLLGKRQQND